jgi:hypothetical protein
VRVVLGVEDDFGVPRSLRDVEGDVRIGRLDLGESQVESRLLAQLPRGRDLGGLTGLPRAGRRRPRPVPREVRPEVSGWRTRSSRPSAASRHTTTQQAYGRSAATGTPSHVLATVRR